MMMKKEQDLNKNRGVMQFRIDKETKDQFMSICKSKAINSSELIRQWIQKFIKDNKNSRE